MTLSELRILFSEILSYSFIPVILIGIYFWSGLSKEFKILLIGLITTLLITFCSNLTIRWHWENNIFLNYISTLNDIVIMTLYFSTIIKKDTLKKIVLFVGCGCIPLTIVDAFWITGYKNPNSITGGIETLCVLFINISCLSKLIKYKEGKLMNYGMFWANAAIFLNNSFPIFLQLFNEQLYLYSSDLFFQFDIFIKIILIIANIFYALAFIYAKPKTQKI